MATDAPLELDVDGRAVTISHPDKVLFPETGYTKRDLAAYFCAVGPELLHYVAERPVVLRRYPNGAAGESFFQKRAPSGPEWVGRVEITFPSGNRAVELCPTSVAEIVWAANLGCLELHPWAVRRGRLDHPDELRVDLDPQPGVGFEEIRETAFLVREHLALAGLEGMPKTSGSRGVHVLVPIEPRWEFPDVRRAALALGRAVQRERPEMVTTEWWKEDRGERVFVDYNQNARDRTVASAYSVRPLPDARVSCPVEWNELVSLDPASFTLATVPDRLVALGARPPRPPEASGSLEVLLAWAAADDAAGVPDAPWPPFTRRQPREPRRSRPKPEA